jgi:hypothetical protein
MAAEFPLTPGRGDVYSLDDASAWFEKTGWRLIDHKPLAGPTANFRTRLLLRFEPFDEYSEMRGNRRRERVVLVFQSSTNCRGEVSVFSAREICIAWRCAGDNPLPNPMIDPISCCGDVAHVPVP